MDELVQALVAAGVAFLGALTVAIGILGTYAAKVLAARGEIYLAQLKEKASDKAVQAVEEQSRIAPVSNKLAEALRIADEATPRSVPIGREDIQAGVTRLRASLPNSSLFPSQPPAPFAEESQTLPPPPRR